MILFDLLIGSSPHPMWKWHTVEPLFMTPSLIRALVQVHSSQWESIFLLCRLTFPSVFGVYMTVTLMVMCKSMYSHVTVIRPYAHSLLNSLGTKLQFSHNKDHNVRSLGLIATASTCMRQVQCPWNLGVVFAWIRKQATFHPLMQPGNEATESLYLTLGWPFT